MSEIDGIIIGNIKQIGCYLDDSVVSLDVMSADLIVETISKCLSIIHPSFEISINSTLPQNMAHRFKIGTKLASCVKELGYKGDVGYDTFLYSNVPEVRRVFMFLIDKLPKEQQHIVKSTNLSSMDNLKQDISNVMKNILKKPFKAPKPNALSPCQLHHKFNATRLIVPDLFEMNSKRNDYYQNYVKPVWSQPHDSRDFLASLIYTNALQSIFFCEPSGYQLNDQNTSKLILQGLQYKDENKKPFSKASIVKVNDFSNNCDNTQIMVQSSSNFLELPIVEKEDSMVEALNLESLKNDLSSLIEDIKSTSNQINEISNNIKHMENKRIQLSSNFYKTKEDIIKSKKLLQLLPSADNNLEKLKAMYTTQTNKLLYMKSQFESLKLTLDNELKDLQHQYNQRTSESMMKKELVEEMEAEMKVLLNEYQEKKLLYNRLSDLKSKSESGRSQYTDRILEIVENIKKQNIEIDKILSENLLLNKDVNILMGVLERTYTVTDELVFKDAKTDESIKKTYKLLAAMHQNFTALRNSIQDIGNVKKEISHLEEQLESKMNSKIEKNLEKARKDLELIKLENENLKIKIINKSV